MSALLPLVLSLYVLFTSVLSARIGESQSELEARLDRSGKGMRIDDQDLAEFHINRSPLGNLTEFLPEAEIEVYYKLNSDVIPTSRKLWELDGNGRRTDKPVRSPEGWLLQVVYLNGVSILEFYRRSQSLTVVETNGILSLNKGQSEWEEGKVSKGDGKDVIQPEVFKHNHYRADLAIYANVGGDTMLLFDPRLDKMIKERRLAQAMEMAPESLDGF